MSDQGRTLLGLLDSMSESSLRELLRQLLQEHPEWLEAYLLDEINWTGPKYHRTASIT